MKVLIITGGTVDAEARQSALAFAPDLTIAADKGIENALRAGIPFDRILGDFDSIDPQALDQARGQHLPETVFPTHKDYTDTELALFAAMQEAGTGGQILILGGTGTRLDHTLANLFLLKQPADQGIDCLIQDGHDQIRLLKGPARLTLAKDPAWPFVSLLPVFGSAQDVTLEGFQYPLQDGVLEPGVSLGISNELDAEEGSVSLKAGYLLVLRTRD